MEHAVKLIEDEEKFTKISEKFLIRFIRSLVRSLTRSGHLTIDFENTTESVRKWWLWGVSTILDKGFVATKAMRLF